MNSISRRMLSFLLGGLIAVTLIAGVATYLKAREEMDELFDYQLIQVAHAFSRQESVSSLHSSSIDFEEEAELAIQIWQGKAPVSALTRGTTLSPQREGFSTVYYGNKFWRVFVLRAGSRTIQISQPIEARREISVNFALRTLVPLLVTLSFFCLFIWLSVRKGLQPLTRLAEEISRRSPSSLDPLPGGELPTEILPLVSRLNLLLERLGDAIELQKRFVADAAHELRTPLTVVGLQLHILERSSSETERTEAISTLHDGIDRATRMVSQLLVLARLEPEAPVVLSDVTLGELAGEVVAERSRIAEKKSIDLGITDSEPIMVHSEIEALRAIITNLVDNAVNYTPPGGTVDVAVRSSERDAIIEVVDTGPGIPPAERKRVFDRFYRRGGGDCSSSGLGLAIVKSAVERLGGAVTLAEGDGEKGLRVTVVIPRTTPQRG
jgi:two-component system, OmpR family, sensor kinase